MCRRFIFLRLSGKYLRMTKLIPSWLTMLRLKMGFKKINETKRMVDNIKTVFTTLCDLCDPQCTTHLLPAYFYCWMKNNIAFGSFRTWKWFEWLMKRIMGITRNGCFLLLIACFIWQVVGILLMKEKVNITVDTVICMALIWDSFINVTFELHAIDMLSWVCGLL